MVANHTDLEKRLWSAVDNLRANSKLRGSEDSMPVLGLIFLKYAEHRFLHVQQELEANLLHIATTFSRMNHFDFT